MPTITDQSRFDVPVSYRITMDGAEFSWGSQNVVSINDLKNVSEQTDGKFSVSDLNLEIADPTGTLWGSVFGNGTTAFGKIMTVDVTVGGTYSFSTKDSGQVYKKLSGTAGGSTYRVHTGKIFYVSRSSRKIRINSKTNTRFLSELQFQPPITDANLVYNLASGTYGSYAFFDTYVNLPQRRAFIQEIAYDIKDDDNFKVKAHYSPFNVLSASHLGTGTNSDIGIGIGTEVYGPGTDSVGNLHGGTRVKYANQLFFEAYPETELEGTFLGSLFGTISDLGDARVNGYTSVETAETAKVKNADGTFYPIMKMRFVDTKDIDGAKYFLYQAKFNVRAGPASMLRALVTSKFVSDQFAGTDFSTGSDYTESQNAYAFSNFIYRHSPKNNDVLPVIKSMVNSTFGLFGINENNVFEYRAYGPKNIAATIASYTDNDFTDSSIENDFEEAYTKISLNYNYNNESGTFSSYTSGTLPTWVQHTERHLELESRLIENDNEASLLVSRLLQRYKYTNPKLTFSGPLHLSKLKIGDLISVASADSWNGTKIAQVVGYTKSFTKNEHTIECLDGESLWQRRGYAQFEDGVSLPNSGNEFSSAIWETHVGTRNTTLYGPAFVWW